MNAPPPLPPPATIKHQLCRSRSSPFLLPPGSFSTATSCVLPTLLDMLSSSCLEDNPWHKFPFTGFVATSAIVTLMVDSLATSIYSQKCNAGGGVLIPKGERDEELAAAPPSFGHMHGHSHHLDQTKTAGSVGSQLMRYRVIAMVLELGIIVHSIVIGLSLGASNNTCSIKGLMAALCFHRMFEGMGLGGCILQQNPNYIFLLTNFHFLYYVSTRLSTSYSRMMVMVFFFAVTMPFGIALGLALSNTYKENSPTTLISVGLLNASSAGLLIYMALVDLFAADFMGQKLQGSIKLQLKSYADVLLGAGGMSLMAKWA
ncbi:hypothetical protein Patl1_11793 [Pistacia atlantica]|uniref:Uncharacterized protein n=1 Tax=Pistacia atlantica TaxID=434234 RepID=A0ACC1A5Z7_9ROSI|nr:hypothetical protein Patl1_11793 [Pistacia atlantica]